jgi:glycosyltransferase involved in cell wall biosynthesis
MGRLRALLVAESANPDEIGAAAAGWGHARAVAQLTEAHLVTEARNRVAIEAAGFVHDSDFTALDSEAAIQPLRQSKAAVSRAIGRDWRFDAASQLLPHYSFELRFWQRYGQEIEAGAWDVVHRITPLGPTVPSPAVPSIIAPRCRRAGVPFVWGPINGEVPWPAGFGSGQGRNGGRRLPGPDVAKLLPGAGSAQRDARAILVGSRATMNQLSPEARKRAVLVPQHAIDPERFGRVRTGPVSSPLRVAFVGRLRAHRGVDMLLEALTDLLRAGRVELDVMGDGPQLGPLRDLSERLGLARHVRLDGRVEHRYIPYRLLQADVFGFPSVREPGAGPVMEAMALGLLPVVADHGGPAELVTDRTGFRVPAVGRDALVAGLRKVFEELVAEPGVIRPMGARARERILAHDTWPLRAEQTLAVYQWVTGRARKPDFEPPSPDRRFGPPDRTPTIRSTHE